MKTDSTPAYDQLRQELKRLQSAPVPDLGQIEKVIDELEHMQLVIKGEHGHKGNNPNE